MGHHCQSRPPGRDTQPPPHAGRGLCLPCETRGRHILTGYPSLWADVVARVGKDEAAHPPSGSPGAVRRTEAPTPLREDFDALARQIVWTLTAWELPVRDVAHLAQVPERGVRDHVAVARAAATLHAYYSVLLALPVTAYLDYETGQPAEDDGPGAVVQISTLYRQARNRLGVTRRRVWRDLPCPPPPDGVQPGAGGYGCGEYTLGEVIGSGLVDCSTCGWWCTTEEYSSYAATFLPPTRVAA